jgi:hypothetical protein
MIKELRGITRIVVNDCYGNFGLSDSARERYKNMVGITEGDFMDDKIPRNDPYLISIVRDMGMAANGPNAKLKIIEVPSDVDWIIQDYDGVEWVAEKHRIWT